MCGGSFITTAGVELYGGGFEGGFRAALNLRTSFPATGGGIWQGAEVQILGGIYGAGQVTGGGYGVVIESFEAALGYDFLLLGGRNRRDLRRGIGAFVAVTTGVQYAQVITLANALDGTVGAIFEVLLPTYDASKRRIASAFLKFEPRWLPAAGVTFYGFGAGAAF